MTGRGRFATTRWTLIRAAAGAEGGDARLALEELCALYWYPLYAFLRRSGRDREVAGDLVQGLFLVLLERRDLAGLAAEGGRFRSWLLTALRHHEAQVARDAARLKRGGGRTILSFDLDQAEDRYGREPLDQRGGPEGLLLRRWALCALEAARARLRAEAEDRGRLGVHDALLPYLSSSPPRGELEKLAAGLGMAPGTLKVALHRQRRRFGEILREVVAETVAEDELEAELGLLLEALS